MFSTKAVITTTAVLALCAVAAFMLDIDIRLQQASAESAGVTADESSPSGAQPLRDVYYPGTEELAADEMRVIACGTGMPMTRL